MSQQPQESQEGQEQQTGANASQEPGQAPSSSSAPPPVPPTVPPPVPPEELKPWYYQYWFFYPTIVFWPLWPVLILRSPWHNGLVSGSLAWAMLISGSYIAYQVSGGTDLINRIQAGDRWALLVLQVISPGLLLTVITQIHWLRNRRRIKSAPPSNPAPASPTAQPPAANSRRRNRRRGRRRR